MLFLLLKTLSFPISSRPIPYPTFIFYCKSHFRHKASWRPPHSRQVQLGARPLCSQTSSVTVLATPQTPPLASSSLLPTSLLFSLCTSDSLPQPYAPLPWLSSASESLFCPSLRPSSLVPTPDLLTSLPMVNSGAWCHGGSNWNCFSPASLPTPAHLKFRLTAAYWFPISKRCCN